MVKRGPKTPVDQLQAALTRSLKESVAEAVSSVCESFQQAVDQQAASATSASAPAENTADYDAYYNHCRRLVDYMQQYMETSPGFSEQMDRIILACHSGATQRVLSSVVTKQLWMRRRGDVAPPPERETRSSRKSSSSGSGSGRGRGRTTAVKKEKKEVLRSSSSGRMSTRASTESPAMHTRSASGSKRVATRGSPQDTQPVKRPRRAAARKVIQDSSDEGEEEEEEEEKPVPVKTRTAKKQVQEKEEDDDELLSFEDAIGELCYADRRTPSQTEFFKKRLRKSIQFVDALLCKPPAGKVCARGCKKIRAQMCSSSTPCKNKMCRIWHDVEAHTDRCQNAQCEFKNRILLRETMHKLEMKEQQVAETKTDLEAKQAELKDATGSNDEKEALEEDVASLEHSLEEFESELAVLEATKKTFWGNLNEIGIVVADDVRDSFPEFTTHYEDKRAPRKARKTIAAEALAASIRSSRAATRPEGAGPHDSDADAEDADAESAGARIPRRTARRSTSSARHSAHEIDEETKGDDEETKGEDEDEEVYEHDPNDLPRPDEPPLPPAGPPPFRQNPEWDRDFAVSASGYSIHPPADDLEAPAVATNTEPPKEIAESSAAEIEPTQEATEPAEPATVSSNGLTEEQLADMQRASEAISGLMADISPDQPPAELPVVSAPEPANTTGFTIRGSQPQNP